MKIDVTAVILDLDDKPLKQPKDGELEVITLADVLVGTLGSPDEHATPKEKIDKIVLAMRVRDAEKKKILLAVDIDELNMLRTAAGKSPFPIVVKRVYDFLAITGDK